MTTSETSIHRLHVPLVSLSVCSCFYFLLTGSVLFVHARLYLNQAVCCLSSLRLCVTPPFANELRLPSKARDSQHTEEVWTRSRKPCFLDHVIRVEMEIGARLLKLSCSWCGENEKIGAHTHTQTQRDVRARRSFFNTRTLARTQATATHLPQAGKKKTDGISCQLQKRLFPVFRPAKANRACHNSRTAFCEFIFMTAPSNCWGN